MWPGCASGSQPGREANAPTLTSPSAADAYLAILRGAEQPSTRRTDGRILRWIVTEFGGNIAPDINPDRFAAWFTAQWGLTGN